MFVHMSLRLVSIDFHDSCFPAFRNILLLNGRLCKLIVVVLENMCLFLVAQLVFGLQSLMIARDSFIDKVSLWLTLSLDHFGSYLDWWLVSCRNWVDILTHRYCACTDEGWSTHTRCDRWIATRNPQQNIWFRWWRIVQLSLRMWLLFQTSLG